MLTWSELPEHARLWIYPANRELNAEQAGRVERSASRFAEKWTAHRRDLQAYAGLWHRRFLVLGVDEAAAAASGCSIDASVRFVKELGAELNLDFFDRMLFFVKDGEAVRALPKAQFEEAFAKTELTPASVVLDPLVATKAEAIRAFAKPLAESWHARFV